MGRIYRVTFENVLVTAPQDLIQINGAAGKMLRIFHRWVGCTDTTISVTQQQISLRERFLGATVTNGSGGTTPTPQRNDPGDAAASLTAFANNTTKASSGGTINTLWENGVYLFNGYDDTLVAPYPIGPGEAYVFELLSTVSGTVHLSGGVEVEEIGG